MKSKDAASLLTAPHHSTELTPKSHDEALRLRAAILRLRCASLRLELRPTAEGADIIFVQYGDRQGHDNSAPGCSSVVMQLR